MRWNWPARLRCPCRAGCDRDTPPLSTSEPSRRQTEPSSSPITPAPMTRNILGTVSSSKRARRPDHDCFLVPLPPTPGSAATSEPVAITMFFVSRSWFDAVLALATPTCPTAAIPRRAVEHVDLVLFKQERCSPNRADRKRPILLIPTRTERHALAQSRRPMGMTRYSLRSENPGMSQPSRGLV